MSEQLNDKSAENKKSHSSGKDESDSLFNRSVETPKNAGDSKDRAREFSTLPKAGDAASGTGKHEDSLYATIMKDVKDLKNYGSKLVDTTEAAVEKTVKSLTKGKSEEKNMLSSFELVGHDARAERKNEAAPIKDMSGHVGKAVVDAGEMIKNMSKEAYHSQEAAFVTVANELADSPKLRELVTDKSGYINLSSVDHALKVDAGATVLAEKHGTPGPQELSSQEREALVNVRTHIKDAEAVAEAIVGAGAGNSAIAGVAFAGIAAKSLDGFSTNEIAKTLSHITSDHKKADLTIAGALAAGGAGALAGLLLADHLKPKPDNKQKETEDKPKEPDKPKEQDKPVEKPPTPRVDVPQITEAEFPTVAKQVLAKLDTNHTGTITKDQLAKALEDPQFKGKEAQALAAMYQSFDLMHNLSKHEGMLSSKSITAGDLDKYAEVQKAQAQRTKEAYDMKYWAHVNLSKFDKNNSGSLTKDELESAIKDPKTSDNDREMLQTIQKHYSEMGHMWERGVNLNALDSFADNIHHDSDNAKLVIQVWGTCYNVNKGQKPEISHDLYTDSKNPLNSINPDAIKQGSIGDCYYVSSLAAVAKAHPEMIRDAIKDNGNGTYTVTFPGDKDHPITVKAPTEAEQGLYNHGSPNGLWASVMEKAYGDYCNQHFWRRSPLNITGGNTPEEGADGGGRTAGAMKLLMGKDVFTNTTTFTFQSTMARDFEHAFSSHPAKAVTAGINGSLPFTGEQTSDGFYKGHAYTITNFVPDGKGGGMVTIRNPWGGTDGTTSGTITIPLEKFMKNFSDVAIER